MSYEGYTEFLCENGHYHTVSCWDSDPVCECGADLAYRHSVDQTNGYSTRNSYSCNAPKIEIGFDDKWNEDHYGNRYAVKVHRFAPPQRGRIWSRLSPSPQSRGIA